MSCDDCHYFRGYKGTPFGRCYNHPDDGDILHDDNTPIPEDSISFPFTVPRWGNFLCEAPKSDLKPPPWEYVSREEQRSSMGPTKQNAN